MLTGYILTICGITFIFGGIALTAIHVIVDGVKEYPVGIIITTTIIISLGWILFTVGIESLMFSRKTKLSYKKNLIDTDDFQIILNDNGKDVRLGDTRKPERVLP